MATYTAPLRDMRFCLHELHDSSALSQLPGLEQATPDLVDAILEEAAKLSQEVLFPLNLSGDKEGCTYENGVVRTPAGFKDAYKQLIEGGWTSLACDPAYGGQGMPMLVSTVFEEMVSSANLAFGMYPGLSHGAYRAIHAHASDELKAEYLPRLVDGTWSGTMCLTEPQCGTDDPLDTLTEDDVTALERQGFMTLVRNPASLARTEHMLATGKPLRN